MEKAQKVIAGFFVVVILIIAGLGGYYAYKNSKTITISGGDILYYSLTCPHCKIVEAYIQDNNISSKIKFENIEVSQNSTAANELIKTGRYCKLDSPEIGAIPLLIYNNSCYLGDTPIIDFLNKTAALIN